MSRCDSAAMVSKTSDDLPEPETPVKTVSRRLGMSRSTPWRLLARAPRTRMAPQGDDATSPQPAAFLTRAAIRSSCSGVSSRMANEVGHIVPSSIRASGWKPKVA